MSDHATAKHASTELANKGLLRLPEVLKIIPVSRSTWYLGVKNRDYPAPVRIGRRAVAWRRHEVEARAFRFTGSWDEHATHNEAQQQQ